jgi:signal transduction histidine kinase/ActR/RegA family two-component response regulator
MAASEENQELQKELKRLKLENSWISRELRITKNYFEKVNRTLEAKETLGQALAAANTRQQAYIDMLLESCPNIILLFDREGKLVLGTEQFLKLTGTPDFNSIKNRSYREILAPCLPEQDIAELGNIALKVISPKHGGGEKRVLINKWIDFGKTGESRYYAIEITVISGRKGEDAGINTGVLAVFTDMTDLLREKERAEAASSAKSDFLAVMSHEIRTPMNAILGLNEILSRSDMTDAQRKYLNDIKKSAHSLLTIINDILDFSKIEAGKLEIINTNYNLGSLLDNLYSMFTVLFKAKNLILNFTIDENIPYAVSGDENRTRQVLTNLLSNALKYTREGQIDFSARLEKTGEQEMLRFDIKDTGIGIRKEDTEKLFKPFEQLDTRKNRNVVGTGLGLAICYKLCRLMGGDLRLESEYGKGSCFSVVLPYAPAEAHAEEAVPEQRDFSVRDAKLLVVDDIEINLEVCAAMLESFGIKADLAASGRQAIEMAAKTNYDIIFMDHMMPEMDGLETTKHIRSFGGFCEKVPIVALTANVINGAEQMFMEHQFNGFLAKPIEIAALGRCLRQWLPAEKIIEV